MKKLIFFLLLIRVFVSPVSAQYPNATPGNGIIVSRYDTLRQSTIADSFHTVGQVMTCIDKYGDGIWGYGSFNPIPTVDSFAAVILDTVNVANNSITIVKSATQIAHLVVVLPPGATGDKIVFQVTIIPAVFTITGAGFSTISSNKVYLLKGGGAVTLYNIGGGWN